MPATATAWQALPIAIISTRVPEYVVYTVHRALWIIWIHDIILSLVHYTFLAVAGDYGGLVDESMFNVKGGQPFSVGFGTFNRP